MNIPESLIEKEIKSAKKASYAIGVVTKDSQHIQGQIYDDMGETEIGKSVFEIGSTTKTFTSLLLAKLAREGRLSLDEPIVTFKPEYKNALSSKGKEITFRHLATHQSGLPREDMKKLRKRMKENKQDKDNFFKHYTLDDLHQFYLDFDLKKEIGKKWGYSNIGVGLLGNVLSEVVKMDYEEAIKSHILTPIGMNDTFIHGNEEQLKRYVKPYNKKGERIPPIEIPAVQGAGAFKSTLHDMMIYLQHQMSLVDSPLKEEIDLTHQLQGVKANKRIQMGLSWFIENKKWSSYPLIHHGGTTMGFHTYFGFLKEEQIGIVMFSTIQISTIRLIKMLLGLSGTVNENHAEFVFKEFIQNK
ncbi:serine hydrolase domain-containing protein [Cytobacillus sp. FJAT-54145]|uniref:Serine hydrolase domain-containing protein n=1 Tax=Cytobacillus spartinae TaxID=3299023 RepID=A0ABW6K9C7_9BACI